MEKFIIFRPDIHRSIVMDLAEDYYNWMACELKSNYDIDVDPVIGTTLRDHVEKDVDEFISSISKNGVFYLIQVDDKIVGMGALRKVKEGIGEIKRMYVRPAFRGKGIGRAMLEHLTAAAREIGYPRVWLDSTRFMKEAHSLYRSVGFREIAPYPESEIPEELQEHWVFMELQLQSP